MRSIQDDGGTMFGAARGGASMTALEPLRAATFAGLLDPTLLGRRFGVIRAIEREPLGTVGFSGSSHERIVIQREAGDAVPLVLKRTDLRADWTAYRTGDTRGRDPGLLLEPDFAGAWDVFECPYVAYAVEPPVVGALMRDVSPWLLPDRREPVTPAIEALLLDRLATLHARFWDSPTLAESGLSRAADLVTMLAPVVHADDARRPPPDVLSQRVRAGWALALPRLPQRVAAALEAPRAAWAERFAGVPHTLIHGDAKVANFAFLAEGRVAAFDWQLAAHAPAAVELGWYVAINASRLARSKADIFAAYRAGLEAALGRALHTPAWREQERLAILAGATTLLWSKALNDAARVAGADVEWRWWVEQLEAAC